MIILKPSPILILLALELILNGVFLVLACNFSTSGSISIVLLILFLLSVAVVETVILTTAQIKASSKNSS